MARFTVGGVPFEELTQEEQLAIRQRVTDVVAEVVTQEVEKMIDESKSIDEIKKFLKLDKEVQ